MSIREPAKNPAGLAQLKDRVRQDLSWLDQPCRSWVVPHSADGGRVMDVVVIGGGMAGLTVSGYLRRYGVDNHVVLDRAPAGREGPWRTYARMETLRSPKTLAGPCMGLASLTFRAWYEACFGAAAWETLDRIPTGMWMDYLVWLRDILALPVRNGVTLDNISLRDDGLVSLQLTADGRPETLICRHVVLATGRDGLGGGYVPPVIAALPRNLWSHSAGMIDFEALKGKRIAVVGAGASAMDNAAVALESGAGRVDMLIRRRDLPRVNKFTGIGSMGVVLGFESLPDGWKWRFLDCVLSAQTPPPRSSVLRVSRHPNGFFHLGCEIRSLAATAGGVSINTSRGTMEADFIIAATGFCVDLARRPELFGIARYIRFWKDRFTPEPQDMPSGTLNAELQYSPDLGKGFEFLEKNPGECPSLRFIHCFCFPATLSHGKVSGDIPAISDGAERLVRHIIGSLFVDDRATYYNSLVTFEDAELSGDEWVDSPLPVS